jgi:hypothetical protein
MTVALIVAVLCLILTNRLWLALGLILLAPTVSVAWTMLLEWFTPGLKDRRR